jgi:zinc D-Ala-D-Ala carboxypeptidase
LAWPTRRHRRPSRPSKLFARTYWSPFGWRWANQCAEANKAVGGSSSSQHCKGEAADIEFDGFDNKKLAQKIIDMKLPFDQLILEFYKPGDPNSGWVHVSHKKGGKQRGEVIRAIKEDGKTKYVPGLG